MATPAGSTLADHLARTGLRLPAAPTAVAAYVPARCHGGLVYTSGQLPFRDGVLPATGLVGDQVGVELARELARQCLLNALAAVVGAAGGAAQVHGVLSVTGYVASAPGFTAQPAVLDGASLLLGELFGPSGGHVRTAVGVAALPLGAPVELALVALLA